MSVSAKQVMDLRAATGMPMMKCKKALEAEGGDYERAIERLRKEGLKAADVRADRKTSEGLVRVALADDLRSATLVAVSCETDPVAKTPLFVGFVDRLAAHVAARAPRDVAETLAQPWIDDPGQSVEEVLKGLVARIGENMRVEAVGRLEADAPGLVGAYVHFTQKDAAVAALAVEPGRDPATLRDLAKNLCMHIVFARPTALSRDEIPAEVRAREMAIARAQVDEDPRMASKPEAVRDRAAEGKLASFYAQAVLAEQEWAVDATRRQTVADLLAEHGARVTAFRRLQVGG